MIKTAAKKIASGILAAVMLTAAAAELPAVSAEDGSQLLGETTFDHKMLPWHTVEVAPAKQNFRISDGEAAIQILVPTGGDKEISDLQFRHRGLNFHKDHVYKVSFQVKSKRDGMVLRSVIGQVGGEWEEYFVLDGETGDMHMGPHMEGQWGTPVKLTTEYRTFEGTFIPTRDIEAAEWRMQYAYDDRIGGNAQAGDEIFFDNMSIQCTTCTECGRKYESSYGRTGRGWSNLENNFISVNQLGYYPKQQKIAVLGDNQGDILDGAPRITLEKGKQYSWELIDADTGEKAGSGTSGAAFADRDSLDTVAKIDFSDCQTPGTYYLRIKGEKWRSFPFRIGDDIYQESGNDLLTNTLNYFYQDRAGTAIEQDFITSGNRMQLAHADGFQNRAEFVQTEWHNEYLSESEAVTDYKSSKISTNSGWYAACDYGQYMTEGGIAVWTLQNMYERAIQNKAGTEKFRDGSGTVVVPETGNGIPDILDECRYELDFMASMKVTPDEPTWGDYAGLYYHKVQDYRWLGLAVQPWDYGSDYHAVRIVKPPTFAATLNYAACAAQAARLWAPYDQEYANSLLKSAKEAYQAYKHLWYEADLTTVTHPYYHTSCVKEELNEKSLYAPLLQTNSGPAYGDFEVRDDDYWAACEIFISAKEMKDADADTYFKELSRYQNAFKVSSRIHNGGAQYGSYTALSWDETASAGSLSLALHTELLDAGQSKELSDSILAAADSYAETTEKQGYGNPYLYDGPGYYDMSSSLSPVLIEYGYEYGSNGMTLNNMIAMAYAYDLTGDSKYMSGVISGMNYLLGCNPLAFSFITGYGTYREQNPSHKFWAKELDSSLPEAPDGVICSGPTPRILGDQYARALGFEVGEPDTPSQRSFVDSVESWATNEATLCYNAPLAWVVSFLQDEAPVTAIDAQPGDVNADGKADASDAAALMQYLISGKKLKAPAAADMNQDGIVNAADLSLLKRLLFK
ncbi:MAG: glycoside hydrolase family 9 protein [Oscillospiraceae bacterium]|nr:glycoside hydrolase family 9 protein [Oscillospiraceae bacterium]